MAGGIIPTCSGKWAVLLRPDKRATLRAGLLDIVDAAGLDGIDIDVEGALLTKIDQAGDYTPFIADLSAALKARKKLLTVATASYEGGMIPVASIPNFDLVMPISYVAIGASWGQPGSEHATEGQAARDVALWLARGVRPERLALGCPFSAKATAHTQPAMTSAPCTRNTARQHCAPMTSVGHARAATTSPSTRWRRWGERLRSRRPAPAGSWYGNHSGHARPDARNDGRAGAIRKGCGGGELTRIDQCNISRAS